MMNSIGAVFRDWAGSVQQSLRSVVGQHVPRRRLALCGAALLVLQVFCCCCPIPLTLSSAAGVVAQPARANLCEQTRCYPPGR